MPEALRKELWAFYYDQLADGVDVGYSPTLEQYNPDLAQKLKYSVAEFSAFKETSFKGEVEALLTKNGKVVPWSQFKKEALKVSGLYNVDWMQTEYNQTVATANMAGKWQDFQQNKDLYPNLRYVAVMDKRTRDQHRQWNGLVAPIDHPIWKKIYPPSDWGCRCDVVQTDDAVSPDLPQPTVKEAFDNNAGETGKVFKTVPYTEGMSKADVKKAKAKAKKYVKEKG